VKETVTVSGITPGGSLSQALTAKAAPGGSALPQVGDRVFAIDGKAVFDVSSAPQLCLGPAGSRVSILFGSMLPFMHLVYGLLVYFF